MDEQYEMWTKDELIQRIWELEGNVKEYESQLQFINNVNQRLAEQNNMLIETVNSLARLLNNGIHELRQSNQSAHISPYLKSMMQGE